MFLCAASLRAEPLQEDVLKCAFIFHFINFTQWNDQDQDYTVCIPDDRPLLDVSRKALAGKVIHGRPIRVSARSHGCHVLVSNDVPYTRSTLTIGLLQRGALLEFREVNHKLRFAVNLEQIKQSQLKISSQLLKLAILE